LVRQELIKALSDFKQWVTAPSSSQTQQSKPLVKVSDVGHLVDTLNVLAGRSNLNIENQLSRWSEIW
jgi:hypothetical protein